MFWPEVITILYLQPLEVRLRQAIISYPYCPLLRSEFVDGSVLSVLFFLCPWTSPKLPAFSQASECRRRENHCSHVVFSCNVLCCCCVFCFQTPLYNALCMGKVKLVEVMIHLGANVNSQCCFETQVMFFVFLCFTPFFYFICTLFTCYVELSNCPFFFFFLLIFVCVEFAWPNRQIFYFQIQTQIQIQKTLLSVTIITIRWTFFFAHTSSATFNNAVKLNTLKTGGITHKEQLT